ENAPPEPRPPARAHGVAHVDDVDPPPPQPFPGDDRGGHGCEERPLCVVPEGRAVEPRELAHGRPRQVPRPDLGEARRPPEPARDEGERPRRAADELAQRRPGLDRVRGLEGEAGGGGDVAEPEVRSPHTRPWSDVKKLTTRSRISSRWTAGS